MIYTRSGDKGYTLSPITKEIETKSSPTFNFIGGIDKLLSFLGLVHLKVMEEDKKIIERIIKELHDIMSSYYSKKEYKSEINSILEKEIDKIKIDNFSFILEYYSNETSAFINITRTIAREVEREYHTFLGAFPALKNNYISSFLNRLSDYLYALFLKYEKEKVYY